MAQDQQKKSTQLVLANLKNQNQAMQVFKRPVVPLQKKKSKKVILSEEKYLSELGKIIQRDFFPDLEKLKAQNEYLDAIASNNISKLREIYSKYSSKRRPAFNETPLTFDTPASSIPDSTPLPPSVRSNDSSKTTSSKRSIGDNHSLDSFFGKYTSEDNQSFEEIIEAAEEKLKQKFAILYEAENSSSSILQNALELPGFERQFTAVERPNKLDMWTYKNKNYLMYTPEGVDFTQDEKVEMAKRRQEIDHSNTRLIVNPFDETKNKEAITEASKNNIRGNPEKVGLDGRSLDHTTPQIRGFSFVKSPSPCPSIVDSSPLMTWGEIEGTPFRLDAGDSCYNSTISGPSFRIAETSKREALAHQLAESVGEKHRAMKTKAMEAAKRNMCASPQVRNSLDRLASMSPAARRLTSATRIKDSWATPSPKRSNKPTPLVRINTPSLPTTSKAAPEPQFLPTDIPETNLTDNLLDIPSSASKRLRASDFF
ncbi:unnamed protein product [Chironomus riparius]|uniref:Uncharacterized protein n=1 Tax=Chironomus riparius TaxID=315576 RepID=A0A9N9RYF1_9DIPT|nr:unnamed protein product [Chironomus riparius]